MVLGVASVAGLLATVAARRWPVGDTSGAVGVTARAAADPGRFRSFLRGRVDAGSATGLGLTLALFGIIVCGTLLGVLTWLVRTSDSGLEGIDRRAAAWGARHATDLSTTVIGLITHLGATVTIAGLGIVLCVIARRRLPPRSTLFYLLVVIMGEVAIVNLTKVAVARVRPDIDPLASFSGLSFPSGHTTAAAAFYAAAAMVLGRGRSPRHRSILAGVAVGIAVAVGVTRVLLGVHWLSDVVAGLALGWSWFAICSLAFGGRRLRFGEPAAVAIRAAEADSREPKSVSDPPPGGYSASEGRTL